MLVLMLVLMRALIVGPVMFFFFFFQAEDGIRDYKVTGVQTCALPICRQGLLLVDSPLDPAVAGILKEKALSALAGAQGLVVSDYDKGGVSADLLEIGRASCRERV